MIKKTFEIFMILLILTLIPACKENTIPGNTIENNENTENENMTTDQNKVNTDAIEEETIYLHRVVSNGKKDIEVTVSPNLSIDYYKVSVEGYEAVEIFDGFIIPAAYNNKLIKRLSIKGYSYKGGLVDERVYNNILFYDASDINTLDCTKIKTDNVEELWIFEGGNLTTINNADALGNIDRLTMLGCENLEDISSLSKLRKLTELNLSFAGTQIPYIENLEVLNVSSGIHEKKIDNINILGEMVKLKKITVKDFHYGDMNVLMLVKQLQYLELDNFDSIENVEMLANLAHLKKIKFTNGYLGNLKITKEFFNVESLVIKNVEDFDFIEYFTNLKLLDISGTFADISSLSTIDSLEQLIINGDFDRFIVYDSLQKLEILEIRDSNIINLDGLENLPNLKGLYLIDNAKLVNYSSISHLKNLEKLIFSNIENNWLDKVNDIDFLYSLDNLQELTISLIEVGNIEPLYSLSNLKKLKITYLNQNLDLSNFTNLEKLDIEYADGKYLNGIERLNNIEEIRLFSVTGISDTKMFDKFETLIKLELIWVPVAEISDLSELTNLIYLSIDPDEILIDIDGIRGAVNLKYLIISYAQIDDLSAIKYLKNLKILHLAYGNKLKDTSVLDELSDVKIYK